MPSGKFPNALYSPLRRALSGDWEKTAGGDHGKAGTGMAKDAVWPAT